jgi:hypothetical protein
LVVVLPHAVSRGWSCSLSTARAMRLPRCHCSACTGLMHESTNSGNPGDYTRPWFAWANSLFAGLIMKVCGPRRPVCTHLAPLPRVGSSVVRPRARSPPARAREWPNPCSRRRVPWAKPDTRVSPTRVHSAAALAVGRAARWPLLGGPWHRLLRLVHLATSPHVSHLWCLQLAEEYPNLIF